MEGETVPFAGLIYIGEDGRRDCPLCRSDRGYSDTSKILGLDDFLITIRDLLQVPDEQS